MLVMQGSNTKLDANRKQLELRDRNVCNMQQWGGSASNQGRFQWDCRSRVLQGDCLYLHHSDACKRRLHLQVRISS